MRNTELIIFIVMVVINGGIAVWRKYKQREAARAAKTSVPGRTGGPEAIDGRQATRRAARSAGTQTAAKAPARPTQAVRGGQSTRTAQPARPGQPTRPSAPPVAAPSAFVRQSGAEQSATRRAVAPAAARAPARVAASTPSASRGTVRTDRESLRQAILLREILGPPRAILPYSAPGG